MITTAYQQARGHCLREFVTPTKPCTLAADSKALGLILAPWGLFALVIGVFGS